MTLIRILAVCCVLSLSIAVAQTPATNQPSTPVSYSSISELNQLLDNLQQASQSTQQDLSHLRIDRWKADSDTKHQSQGDAESITRNLQNALPAMMTDLKNSPENLALTFKVYRNLDALYDVLSSVVESAGAFGSKEDFRFLGNDLRSLENSRRGFADRMDKLANAKETEISQLRVALQNARQAEPPKKVVVDDTEPAPKKKTPPKKKAPAKSTSKPGTTPANPPNPNSNNTGK